MISTNIRKNESKIVAITSKQYHDRQLTGWLEINAGLAACFVNLVIDCGDVSEGRELWGNIRACESTLSVVIKQGGFTQCDYGLANFHLSDYDKRVTLPAILLWYHGRDLDNEFGRLHDLYQRTAPEIELSGISLPESNKIKLAGFDTAN